MIKVTDPRVLCASYNRTTITLPSAARLISSTNTAALSNSKYERSSGGERLRFPVIASKRRGDVNAVAASMTSPSADQLFHASRGAYFTVILPGRTVSMSAPTDRRDAFHCELRVAGQTEVVGKDAEIVEIYHAVRV